MDRSEGAFMSQDKFEALIAQGFAPDRPLEQGDFRWQDDGDGPFIAAWRSAQPCPFPELVRETPLAPEAGAAP